MANKKSRILSILRYLETQTDEAHPVSIADIITHLKGLGITASRKTVSADIEQLIDAGVDVVCVAGRRYEYFIGDRHFELPELKLLVDAVQAFKLISPKKSGILIGKLASLTSVYHAEELNRQLYLEKQVKPNNEKIYITIDLLYTAINTGKKVQFKYYEYTRDKKKIYKHDRQVYIFSPYGLIWNNDHYYTAGYSESHGRLITFRVDRIAVPELTDIPAVPRPEGFDMTQYTTSVFRMYDGPVRAVTLKCVNTLMKTIVDRFGEDVDTKPIDDKHFYAHVSVSVSPTFFGWVFSFGGGIEITAPADVSEDYRSQARLAAEKSH